MASLILHHYPMSPFAEKMRAMLGYTQLPWQSVITREMPPRVKLAPLVGGYRRIPVAQIGADVFCDTRIISSEIAALANQPLLALENLSQEQQDFTLDVDSRLFFACIMTGSTKRLNRKVWQSLSMPDIGRLLWDRINMGRRARGPAIPFKQAKPMVLEHLSNMESRLTQDWLFSEQPSLADFTAYHGLWFIRDMGECTFMQEYPITQAWMNRIKAFGHGHATPMNADDALAAAGQAEPREIPDQAQQDEMIGRQVSIAPSDYGQIPTGGELVGSLPERWILAREVTGLGRIHVHFPKHGYQLTLQ